MSIPTPPQRDVEDQAVRASVRASLFGESGDPIKIGRFRVLSRLGSGGMGVVLSAYDEELDRKVAIKLLRSDLAQGSEGRARLKREAQAMAKLSCPNVVSVHEVGEHEGQVFIAMEFVKGQTLKTWMGGDHSWREIVDVFVRAGLGLAAAHDAGIVHRDFKPENVLVGDDGRPRVGDFGLARPTEPDEPKGRDKPTLREVAVSDPPSSDAEGSGSESLTETGTVMGTPAYMSPEQHGGKAPDARSDQFSFCVALWEALHRERPFDGTTSAELAAAKKAGVREDATAGSDVPKAVQQALLRGMSSDPELRFPSMDELLAVLARDPAATHKQVARISAIVVGVAGATALGYFVANEPMISACQPAADRLAGIWDSDRKEAVKSAIVGLDVPEAPESWSALEQRLDEYVGGWSEAYSGVCQAVDRQDPRTLETDRERLACLDHRLQELAAIPEIYLEPDRTTIQQVIPAVSSIRRFEACLSDEGLAAQVPAPADADARRRVQRIRLDLLRARSLAAAGRFDDAIALAESVTEEAVASGFKPVEAEAYFTVGDLRTTAAETQHMLGGGVLEPNRQVEGADALRAALRAAELGRHDEIVARVLLNLAAHADHWRYSEDQRNEWLARADTTVERLGNPPELSAELLHVRTGLMFGRADHSDKRELGAEQLEIAQREWPERGWFGQLGNNRFRVIARAKADLGSALIYKGDVERGRKLFRESMVELEQAMGPTSPYLFVALKHMCGDFSTAEDSLQACERALELARRQPWYAKAGATAELRVSIADRSCRAAESEACEQSLIEAAESCPDAKSCGIQYLNLVLMRVRVMSATQRAEAALAEIDGLEDSLEDSEVWPFIGAQLDLVLPAHRAQVLAKAGRHRAALAEYGRAHKAMKQAGDFELPAHQRGALFSGMASAHLALGHPKQAVTDARKALELLSEPAAFPTPFLPTARFVLARALVRTGGVTDEAIRLAELARDDFAALEPETTRDQAEVEAWLERHARSG